MFPESETGFTLQNSQGDVNAWNGHAISFSGKELRQYERANITGRAQTHPA